MSCLRRSRWRWRWLNSPTITGTVPATATESGIYVSDACRGMVYFSSGSCLKSVVVWNIATREFRIFHGITERVRSSRCQVMSDLATLPITHEYKLVRVIIYFNNTVYIKITRWNINDSKIFLPAKEMDMDFPYKITQFGHCLNTNEAIHWLGHKIEGGPSIVIAFDMTEDKFREISTPFNYDQKTRFNYTLYHQKLALLNENRLAIFGALHTSIGYLSYTVWALNDYGGASESWAKQYAFETRYNLQRIGFWFNGEVVVATMNESPVKMSLYDCHTNQTKSFPVDNTTRQSSITRRALFHFPTPSTMSVLIKIALFKHQSTLLKGSINYKQIISYLGCQTPSSNPDDDEL